MSYLQRGFQETSVVTLPSSVHEFGVSITIGYNFEVYRDLVESTRENYRIGHPFDPDRHALGKGNGLWIIGRNPAGEIIHTQASRVLELGDLSVSDYLSENFADFPPPMPGIDLRRSSFRSGPSARRMHGVVSYHGEFWIGGEPGVYRGSNLSKQLGIFGFEQAMRHWDPDYYLAFMLDVVACKGLPARAGWMHTQPRAIRWVMEGSEAYIDTHLCHLMRDDLIYLSELNQEDEGLLVAA